MNAEHQDQLKSISSYTSKLLRQKFGRGPQSCHASLGGRFLALYIKGFLSPMEEVLLQQGQTDTVTASRQVIIDCVLSELKGMVQTTLQIDIENFYSDWNFQSNSGLIVAVLAAEEEGQAQTDAADSEFANRAAFKEEVQRISSLVQKTPERIETYRVTPKLLIVMRHGLLLMVEHALIQKGIGQTLRIAKGELEKKYFHHDGRFDEILGSRVVDFFVDWDFKRDDSLMCFVLH